MARKKTAKKTARKLILTEADAWSLTEIQATEERLFARAEALTEQRKQAEKQFDTAAAQIEKFISDAREKRASFYGALAKTHKCESIPLAAKLNGQELSWTE